MAPNGRQRALMLQMNAVDRRIDQEVRLLLRLEKFGRTGTLPPSRIVGANGTGRPERVMSTKKDMAPYSRKIL
jgi:hypothetical protein